MTNRYFDKLEQATGGREKSIRWFRDKIRDFGTPPPLQLVNEGEVRPYPYWGRMNFFLYDAKYKDKLPYWDRFPLVLPLEETNNGFIGLNFHYLSIPMRLKLLNIITDFATDRRFDEDTRINTTYRQLKRHPIVKPTIKRYLNSKLDSPFRRINVDEMMMAVLLPIQQFQKQSETKVYSDSRRMMARR
jgi:hypothetical protein